MMSRKTTQMLSPHWFLWGACVCHRGSPAAPSCVEQLWCWCSSLLTSLLLKRRSRATRQAALWPTPRLRRRFSWRTAWPEFLFARCTVLSVMTASYKVILMTTTLSKVPALSSLMIHDALWSLLHLLSSGSKKTTFHSTYKFLNGHACTLDFGQILSLLF